jgi:hypothetical protein
MIYMYVYSSIYTYSLPSSLTFLRRFVVDFLQPSLFRLPSVSFWPEISYELKISSELLLIRILPIPLVLIPNS